MKRLIHIYVINNETALRGWIYWRPELLQTLFPFDIRSLFCVKMSKLPRPVVQNDDLRVFFLDYSDGENRLLGDHLTNSLIQMHPTIDIWGLAEQISSDPSEEGCSSVLFSWPTHSTSSEHPKRIAPNSSPLKFHIEADLQIGRFDGTECKLKKPPGKKVYIGSVETCL